MRYVAVRLCALPGLQTCLPMFGWPRTGSPCCLSPSQRLEDSSGCNSSAAPEASGYGSSKTNEVLILEPSGALTLCTQPALIPALLVVSRGSNSNSINNKPTRQPAKQTTKQRSAAHCVPVSPRQHQQQPEDQEEQEQERNKSWVSILTLKPRLNNQLFE